MFKGSIPALITPFKNGEVDWPAFDNLVEWQIDQGTHALAPCGTTGESPTLSHQEHMDVVERCVNVSNGRIPVIAGTGSNSTREAVRLTKHAKEAGVDAAMVVTPYYNKPTQEGLYEHYRFIHDECDIPIIIYNIPGRSVINMSTETMARLAELPNIVGVKDATGALCRPLETTRACGKDFCQLSGDDITAAAFLAQGGHGVVSVIANIAPAMTAGMQNAWFDGDLKEFARLRDLLAPLGQALFLETSPGPIKYAASRLGICQEDIRRPLVPIQEETRKAVDEAMDYAGLTRPAIKLATG